VDHHSGDGHGVEGGDEVSGIDSKSRRETGRRYTSITIILRKSEDGGSGKADGERGHDTHDVRPCR
jgi:hypothetical protein